MFDALVAIFSHFDHLFWSYVAFVLILILGGVLNWQNRFAQIRKLPEALKSFLGFMSFKSGSRRGVHPLRVFFASVGGMIGIGNIVGIVTAVQIGGPGALFWVWIAAIIGSVIKYSEINLGLKYRIPNARGSYDGGPIIFLRSAFKAKWIPVIVGILLCIYGVEVYQFSVIADALTTSWMLNRYWVIACLLGAVIIAGRGGIKRVGAVCSMIIPFFLIAYISMSSWIIFNSLNELPQILHLVFKSAFQGHAPIGGFVGSGIILTIQQGISRAAYSSDLGIGYDSIIQSESSVVQPEKQAQLSVLGVFVDNVICTLTIFVTLLSGGWKLGAHIDAALLMQNAFSQHFPAMELFMPLFILFVGYSTVISYFAVGSKCAHYLNVRFGEKSYQIYASIAFIIFSFCDQKIALLVMSLAGALLLSINLLGIFRLRKMIS